MVLVDGRMKERDKMDICSSLEGMEVNEEGVGKLKSWRNLKNPLKFRGITSY